jgi:hypothetical protein
MKISMASWNQKPPKIVLPSVLSISISANKVRKRLLS